MNAVADVVVVGGGIAALLSPLGWRAEGWAWSFSEPTLDYPDRVRGETIMPWGVKKRALWASTRYCWMPVLASRRYGRSTRRTPINRQRS